MVTVDKLRSYLRIDGDYEDELLQEFLTAAKAYLSGAVSGYSDNYSAFPEFASKADLLTMVLAVEFYQNRDNSPHEMSYTVRSLMAQLQYFAGGVEISDTGAQTVDDAEVATDAEANEYLDGIFDNAGDYGNSPTVDDDAVATDDETNKLFDSIFGRLE